jgi:hypothetical protein
MRARSQVVSGSSQSLSMRGIDDRGDRVHGTGIDRARRDGGESASSSLTGK